MIVMLALANTTNNGGEPDFTLFVTVLPIISHLWVCATVKVKGWTAGLPFSSLLEKSDLTTKCHFEVTLLGTLTETGTALFSCTYV